MIEERDRAKLLFEAARGGRNVLMGYDDQNKIKRWLDLSEELVGRKRREVVFGGTWFDQHSWYYINHPTDSLEQIVIGHWDFHSQLNRRYGSKSIPVDNDLVLNDFIVDLPKRLSDGGEFEWQLSETINGQSINLVCTIEFLSGHNNQQPNRWITWSLVRRDKS